MELEKVLEIILDGQKEVVRNIEALRTDMTMKVDAFREEMMRYQREHDLQDAKEFRSIRDELGRGLGDLRDRVTKTEMIAAEASSGIDGICNTTENHETRLATLEKTSAVETGRREERTTVKGWVQWLITSLIAAVVGLASFIFGRSK